MAERDRFSLGLDVGSTKVTAVLMLQHGNELPEFIAYATHRRRFLKNGIVADLPAFQASVEECLQKIRSLSKSAPQQATVNIHPSGLQTETGTTELHFKRRRAVRESDLVQIRRKEHFLDEDGLELVHIFPESYSLDNQVNLESPVGMKGDVLKLRMQQVYAPKLQVENIVAAVNACRLKVAHVVIDPYAQLEALTTPDERDMGLILVNIGEFSVKTIAVKGKHVVFVPSVPLGSHHITSDISIGLRTTMRDAERVKTQAGTAIPSLVPEGETVDVPVIGDRTRKQASRQLLAEIIRPRVEEILEHVLDRIDGSLDRTSFHAGFMLTGGTARLTGLMEMAEQILGLPGIPVTFRGFSGKVDAEHQQELNTAIGLALYGLRHHPFRAWGEPGFNVMSKFIHRIWKRGG